MPKIKPCPFCGGEGILETCGEYYNVSCNNRQCGMYLINKARSCRTKQQAISAWNRRVK